MNMGAKDRRDARADPIVPDRYGGPEGPLMTLRGRTF